MRRVVITGLGIYSTIGKNLNEVKDSLFHGRSGIGIDEFRTELGFRSPLTGIIERPNLKGKLDRRQRLGLAEQAEYAYISTLEALENAKINEDFLEKNDVGIIFGNDSSAKAVVNATDILREKKDTMLFGSGIIFQGMNSTVTMNLSVIFKLKGISFTLSAACASGSHCIGLAYLLIKGGYQDTIICGGAQEINPHAMATFDGLNAFSIRVSEPEKASRPFDKDRDGLVPSGGAATVIIESYDSAEKRGAPILGEILGYGFSSNGDHLLVPNVEGPAKALEMSIKDAKLRPEEITYINAHATSTPIGDLSEAKAILRVFGDSNPYVTSTKSNTGHECWMAGASEIVYSMIMMQNSFIAPNLNYSEGDEETSKLNIPVQVIEKDFDIFLSNSFGFGGTNSAIIIQKI